MTFIFVALGGAVGACGRYAISLIPVKSHGKIAVSDSHFDNKPAWCTSDRLYRWNCRKPECI